MCVCSTLFIKWCFYSWVPLDCFPLIIPNSHLYVLPVQGSEYWRFNPRKQRPVSSSYPRRIANWKGLPTNNIQSAVQYTNGYTYFFKVGATPQLTLSLSTLALWIVTINALVHFQVMLAFLPHQDGKYWRFDDDSFSVDKVEEGQAPYPRPTAEWWFACPKTKKVK